MLFEESQPRAERRNMNRGTYRAAALMLTQISRCSAIPLGIRVSDLSRRRGIFCVSRTDAGQDITRE